MSRHIRDWAWGLGAVLAISAFPGMLFIGHREMKRKTADAAKVCRQALPPSVQVASVKATPIPSGEIAECEVYIITRDKEGRLTERVERFSYFVRFSY